MSSSWFDARYNLFDNDVGYNYRGYRPEYNNAGRQPYYDVETSPMVYRRRRPEAPYFDNNYRRQYRQAEAYSDGRYGVVPMEEVFRREEAPPWMSLDDGGYGREWGGGYRMDRRDHHGHHGGHGGIIHQERDEYGDRHHNHRRHSSSGFEEVELYVPICCDKCERKLKKHLEYIPGVESITMDQTTKKVVVIGNVNPADVLNRCRHDKPGSEYWDSLYR